jgi:hypothetical protein
MALTEGKYNRTYHYSFSPGTTSDDRINHEWEQDILRITDNLQHLDNLIHTEKMDGENQCINQYGIFARSHAAATRHPWSNFLKELHPMLKKDLADFDIELFGENMYAKHSIGYPGIESHFYMFGVRKNGIWLSWSDVEMYAELFDFPTVPIIKIDNSKILNINDYKNAILNEVVKESTFGSYDTKTDEKCTMEGIVTRNIGSYSVDEFSKNVFKYVRAKHVNTDIHWSKNWKRAPLKWENYK